MNLGSKIGRFHIHRYQTVRTYMGYYVETCRCGKRRVVGFRALLREIDRLRAAGSVVQSGDTEGTTT